MAPRQRERIVMLLENNPYPQDVRVRAEATSLVAAGHRVTVIAPRASGQPRRERTEGVEVTRFREFDGSSHGTIGFFFEYLVASIALHLKALRALVTGATVLHIHNPPDLFAGAGALFRLAGRKVVFDHHDMFPETVAAKFGQGLATRMAAAAQGLTFVVANHVLATNESYAAIARTQGRKPPEAVTVVRNGPPSAWTRLAAPNRRGSLERVELAYLGAVSTQDGVEGLAPVLAALREGAHRLDVRLTIIGDGDARAAAEAEFRRHRVAEYVTFTGLVPLERVPELIAGADICVDPAPATYVNDRSTMMKIAEYLALGKPVIAYDLLETRRTTAGAALLVAPGDVEAFTDGIARIARDTELRDRLVGQACRRASELTWEHSERALLDAYDRLSSPESRGFSRVFRCEFLR